MQPAAKKPFNISGVALYCLSIVLVMILLLPHVRHFLPANSALYGAQFFVLSFLLSFILVPLLIRIAPLLGLLDYPDEARKHHAVPTPLVGGLAIYLAFVGSMIFNFHFSYEMKGILIGATIIVLVGLADDRWGVSAGLRLLGQFAAVAVLISYGVRVTFVPDYLGGFYVESLITAIWIVGITNSMNFIDGMDGLASGTSIIYSIFFGISAIITHQWYMMFLTIALAGSCLGFFRYNFRLTGRARLFLGDSGATFLGFLLASFAILGEWGRGVLDIAIPVVIMSVLIFDMTLTTIIRIATGEVRSFGQWLHYTGRDHFHHRLSGLGLSQKRSAMVFFLVSICFGMLAIAMIYADFITGLLILLHTILAFSVLAIILVARNRQADNAEADMPRIPSSNE